MGIQRRGFLKAVAVFGLASLRLRSSWLGAKTAAIVETEGMPARSAAKTYDVAVVGAGVFGSWTALHLAKAGKKTEAARYLDELLLEHRGFAEEEEARALLSELKSAQQRDTE